MTLARTQLRNMLEQRLRTDGELDQFLQDHFFEVFRRCSRGMDQVEKRNLLFSLVEPEAIERALQGLEEGKPAVRAAPVRLMLLHAPEDTERIQPLRKHMDALVRAGQITLRGPEDIATPTALETADLVLVLVTADFLADDEIDRLLTRGISQGRAGRVLPVLVRPTNLARTALDSLAPLLVAGRAISLAADRDTAWAEVAAEVSRRIASIAANGSR